MGYEWTDANRGHLRAAAGAGFAGFHVAAVLDCAGRLFFNSLLARGPPRMGQVRRWSIARGFRESTASARKFPIISRVRDMHRCIGEQSRTVLDPSAGICGFRQDFDKPALSARKTRACVMNARTTRNQF